MSWTLGLIGLVAVYGAVLATYLLFAERISNRPRLTVKVNLGFLNQGSNAEKPMLILAASNIGKTPASLSSMGIHLVDGRDFVFLKPSGDSALPHTLAPGKSTRMWIPASRVANTLKECQVTGNAKISGFFTDELERSYRSKWSLFDVSAYEVEKIEETTTASVTSTIASPASEAPRPTFSW